MDFYYVDKVALKNGDHEVHKSSCRFVPDEKDRIFLGYFGSCKDAALEAKRYFKQCNGCYHCCFLCHTD